MAWNNDLLVLCDPDSSSEAVKKARSNITEASRARPEAEAIAGTKTFGLGALGLGAAVGLAALVAAPASLAAVAVAGAIGAAGAAGAGLGSRRAQGEKDKQFSNYFAYLIDEEYKRDPLQNGTAPADLKAMLEAEVDINDGKRTKKYMVLAQNGVNLALIDFLLTAPAPAPALVETHARGLTAANKLAAAAKHSVDFLQVYSFEALYQHCDATEVELAQACYTALSTNLIVRAGRAYNRDQWGEFYHKLANASAKLKKAKNFNFPADLPYAYKNALGGQIDSFLKAGVTFTQLQTLLSDDDQTYSAVGDALWAKLTAGAAIATNDVECRMALSASDRLLTADYPNSVERQKGYAQFGRIITAMTTQANIEALSAAGVTPATFKGFKTVSQLILNQTISVGGLNQYVLSLVVPNPEAGDASAHTMGNIRRALNAELSALQYYPDNQKERLTNIRQALVSLTGPEFNSTAESKGYAVVQEFLSDPSFAAARQALVNPALANGITDNDFEAFKSGDAIMLDNLASPDNPHLLMQANLALGGVKNDDSLVALAPRLLVILNRIKTAGEAGVLTAAQKTENNRQFQQLVTAYNRVLEPSEGIVLGTAYTIHKVLTDIVTSPADRAALRAAGVEQTSFERVLGVPNLRPTFAQRPVATADEKKEATSYLNTASDEDRRNYLIDCVATLLPGDAPAGSPQNTPDNKTLFNNLSPYQQKKMVNMGLKAVVEKASENHSDAIADFTSNIDVCLGAVNQQLQAINKTLQRLGTSSRRSDFQSAKNQIRTAAEGYNRRYDRARLNLILGEAAVAAGSRLVHHAVSWDWTLAQKAQHEQAAIAADDFIPALGVDLTPARKVVVRDKLKARKAFLLREKARLLVVTKVNYEGVSRLQAEQLLAFDRDIGNAERQAVLNAAVAHVAATSPANAVIADALATVVRTVPHNATALQIRELATASAGFAKAIASQNAAIAGPPHFVPAATAALTAAGVIAGAGAAFAPDAMIFFTNAVNAVATIPGAIPSDVVNVATALSALCTTVAGVTEIVQGVVAANPAANPAANHQAEYNAIEGEADRLVNAANPANVAMVTAVTGAMKQAAHDAQTAQGATAATVRAAASDRVMAALKHTADYVGAVAIDAHIARDTFKTTMEEAVGKERMHRAGKGFSFFSPSAAYSSKLRQASESFRETIREAKLDDWAKVEETVARIERLGVQQTALGNNEFLAELIHLGRRLQAKEGRLDFRGYLSNKGTEYKNQLDAVIVKLTESHVRMLAHHCVLREVGTSGYFSDPLEARRFKLECDALKEKIFKLRALAGKLAPPAGLLLPPVFQTLSDTLTAYENAKVANQNPILMKSGLLTIQRPAANLVGHAAMAARPLAAPVVPLVYEAASNVDTSHKQRLVFEVKEDVREEKVETTVTTCTTNESAHVLLEEKVQVQGQGQPVMTDNQLPHKKDLTAQVQLAGRMLLSMLQAHIALHHKTANLGDPFVWPETFFLYANSTNEESEALMRVARTLAQTHGLKVDLSDVEGRRDYSETSKQSEKRQKTLKRFLSDQRPDTVAANLGLAKDVVTEKLSFGKNKMVYIDNRELRDMCQEIDAVLNSMESIEKTISPFPR